MWMNRNLFLKGKNNRTIGPGIQMKAEYRQDRSKRSVSELRKKIPFAIDRLTTPRLLGFRAFAL